MIENEPEAGPVVKVARDLREIERLAGRLDEEAENASASKLMPGGKAMVLLGPVANLEAWENMNQTSERLGRAYTSAEDEDPEEAWSPFQTIVYWSEDWRRQHDAEYGQRATIASEAAFLRWMLPWAWENEPRWDDLARDIRRARLRMEDIVHDGLRAERTRVTCDRDSCEVRPRLIRVRGDSPDEDGYKCTACKHRYDEDDFHRAYRKQLRSEGAERFVPLTDAVDTLRSQGRPERTIRKWLGPNDSEDVVHGYCEVTTRRTLLWWPDLWTKHLTTQMRDRLRRVAR